MEQNTPEKPTQPTVPTVDLRAPRLYAPIEFFTLFEILPTDAEKVEFQRAIYLYAFKAETPATFSTPAVAGFFEVAKWHIDHNNQEYRNAVENNEKKQKRFARNPFNKQHLQIEKFLEATRMKNDLARKQREAENEAKLFLNSRQRKAKEMLNIFRGQIEIENSQLQIRELEAIAFIIEHNLDSDEDKKAVAVCQFLFDYSESEEFFERKQSLDPDPENPEKPAGKIDFLELIEQATRAVETAIDKGKNTSNADLVKYIRETNSKKKKDKQPLLQPVDASGPVATSGKTNGQPAVEEYNPPEVVVEAVDAKRILNAYARQISLNVDRLDLREAETVELIKQHGLENDLRKRGKVFQAIFDYSKSRSFEQQNENAQTTGNKIDVFKIVEKAVAKIEKQLATA